MTTKAARPQREQTLGRRGAIAHVARDQHEQNGSHHVQLVPLYDHGVTNEREADCEYKQRNCRSGTTERTFCQPAEKDQADDGAHKRKKSEREFVVAENGDRATLDEQKSRRGNLVDGQRPGE